jgi:hypothetical protein
MTTTYEDERYPVVPNNVFWPEKGWYTSRGHFSCCYLSCQWNKSKIPDGIILHVGRDPGTVFCIYHSPVKWEDPLLVCVCNDPYHKGIVCPRCGCIEYLKATDNVPKDSIHYDPRLDND